MSVGIKEKTTYFKKVQALQELEPYLPDEAEQQSLLDAYYDAQEDLRLQQEAVTCLGTNTANKQQRNLLDFWSDCREDYNVNVPLQPIGDWKKMYRRPISRDKANTIISQLTRNYIYPQCIAQNNEQFEGVFCLHFFVRSLALSQSLDVRGFPLEHSGPS